MILGVNGILDRCFAESLGFAEGKEIGEEKVNAAKARIVDVFKNAIFDFGGFALMNGVGVREDRLPISRSDIRLRLNRDCKMFVSEVKSRI